MSNNTTVRVTKAQKLEVLKKFIPDDARHVFPGTSDDKGNTVKTAYVFDKDAIMEFLDYEISLLAKKNSGEKKQTDEQKANEGYKDKILAYLENMEVTDEHPGATCSEMFKGIPELAPYSPQKVSALCRQLKQAELITSTEYKGKTMFRLA